MNISEETINILNELYYISFTDSNINSTTPLNATHLSIGFEKFNGKETDSNGYSNYIGKTIKCPNKKEITLDIRKLGYLQRAEIPYWRKTQKIFDCLKVP